MYELVNTSLPNGLIAGTHGFATVAMTKGVSDVLRGRLETLCAYTHRTSVHDATYYQQNPVNWFHVVLPQGEHVVGRVAPSEFDYTGRTNRLAKLRIFRAQEMPSVGAADVLQKEKVWFSQEWQGNPRYLDEDRNTCGHLRMLNPVQSSSAPAWDALFGANGSRLAQQFAWQLEKNVSSGGKVIYFKTSASFDVSGERLLGLFADLINLLPSDIRAKVAFSTYPVSLPSGTGCHLRGIYDLDKFFDASADTQAWVDCENAKIVHPEMLPTQGSAKPQTPFLEKVKESAPVAQERHSKGPKFSIPKTSGRGPDPNSYQNLFAPKKQGPDVLVISLIVGIVIILLVGVGVFFRMIQTNKKQMEDSGAAAAVEEQNKSLEPELGIAERNDGEERKVQPQKEFGQQQKAEKEENEGVSKQQEEVGKAVEGKVDIGTGKAEKEAEEKKHKQTAYLDAKEFRLGEPSYNYNSLKKKCKEPFMEGDGCCVYYYSGSVVTNEPAGYRVNESVPNLGFLRWGVGLSRKLEDVPLVSNGFVLWYNPTSKIVYIDLNRRLSQNEDGEAWFADSSSVDLAQKYFGSDSNFKQLWERYQGGKTKYLIQWKINDRYKSVKPISTEKSKLTHEEMIMEVWKDEAEKYDAAIASSEQKKQQFQKQLEGSQDELKKLQETTNSMSKVKRAYQDLSKKIKKLESEIRDLDSGKKGDWIATKKKEKDDCEKELADMLAEGTATPTGKGNDSKVYKNFDDLKSKIEDKAKEVDDKQGAVKNIETKVEKAEDDVKSAKRSKQKFLDKYKSSIRKVLFRLSVKDEKVKE